MKGQVCREPDITWDQDNCIFFFFAVEETLKKKMITFLIVMMKEHKKIITLYSVMMNEGKEEDYISYCNNEGKFLKRWHFIL